MQAMTVLAGSCHGGEGRERSLGAPHDEEAGLKHVAGHPGVHPAEHAAWALLEVCPPAGADAWAGFQEAAVLPSHVSKGNECQRQVGHCEPGQVVPQAGGRRAIKQQLPGYEGLRATSADVRAPCLSLLLDT